MRTVSGATSGVPPANVSATSRSFHTHRNWKIANAAIAGVSSGIIIRKKIFTWPAPSTRAASTSYCGMSFMKLCSRKIASGSAKIECDSHSSQNEPADAQVDVHAQQRDQRDLDRHDLQREDRDEQEVAAREVASTRTRTPPASASVIGITHRRDA